MKIADVEKASAIAYERWHSWKHTTAKERSKFLSRMATLMSNYHLDLARIITLETGKPLAEAKGEVQYALNYFEFFAEEAKRVYGDIIPSPMKGRKILAMKEPVGPAALITPWNFPCAMVTRKVCSPF